MIPLRRVATQHQGHCCRHSCSLTCSQRFPLLFYRRCSDKHGVFPHTHTTLQHPRTRPWLVQQINALANHLHPGVPVETHLTRRREERPGVESLRANRKMISRIHTLSDRRRLSVGLLTKVTVQPKDTTEEGLTQRDIFLIETFDCLYFFKAITVDWAAPSSGCRDAYVQ